MTRLRYLTAGESHGPALTAILEGCPGRPRAVGRARIDHDLARRQQGYGRGERQAIERDRVRFVGGVRYGRTTGAPIALHRRQPRRRQLGQTLSPEPPDDGRAASRRCACPRPGHADLGGALLYGLDDMRDVIERASARETAAKVACGAVARLLLAAVGCRSPATWSPSAASRPVSRPRRTRSRASRTTRCAVPDAAASARMRAAVDAAIAAGDTLGGVVEVLAYGSPPGVGTYVQGDRRLQSRPRRGGLQRAGHQGPGVRPRLRRGGASAAATCTTRWSTTPRRATGARPTTPAGSRAASRPGSRSCCAPP